MRCIFQSTSEVNSSSPFCNSRIIKNNTVGVFNPIYPWLYVHMNTVLASCFKLLPEDIIKGKVKDISQRYNLCSCKSKHRLNKNIFLYLT